MVKWTVKSFDDSGIIVNDISGETREDIALVIAMSKGEEEITDCPVSISYRVYNSVLQRSIIETLILADDCDDQEIYELTGLSINTIETYRNIFFRLDTAFFSKIDFIDFIETGIKEYSLNEDEPMLNLFLLYRWTLSLGKEFIVWKFRLRQVEYSADRLYTVVMKEAFFYHKEKSMGNTEISMSDYLKSASTILNSVKTSTTIKGHSEDDAGLDILTELGIIVEEVTAPNITLAEISGIEFLNNATQQEK